MYGSREHQFEEILANVRYRWKVCLVAIARFCVARSGVDIQVHPMHAHISYPFTAKYYAIPFIWQHWHNR